MKIWVDADACPAVIKEIIVRAAIKRQITTIFVANKPLFLAKSPYLNFVQVASGADVADQYIAEQAAAVDLVITQDIPLAGVLVPKGIITLSPHGNVFTKDNIAERLSVRNFMHEVRGSGVQTGGPKPFSVQDKLKFANAFDQQLQKLSPK